MNYQINDILSNPSHIIDVPEDVLQNWISKYPFVPLLHLYALKKKENYSDSDLHRTAFHLINREKLYYLLKSKTTTQRESEVEKPISKMEKAIPVQPEKVVENELTPEEITAESTIEITEKTIAEPIQQTEETTKDNELISTQEISANLEATENTPTIEIEEQPLSIADKILLEIQQLKAERAKQAAEAEALVNNAKITDEKNAPATEHIPEESSESITQENTTEIEDGKNVQKLPETTPTLSIQDEVIARIRKIQEEREKQQQSIEHTEALSTTIPLENETVTEDIKIDDSKHTQPVYTETAAASTPLEEKTEAAEEQKTLTIQEEVIARIRKIQEERENKSIQENALPTTAITTSPPIQNEETEVKLPKDTSEIEKNNEVKQSIAEIQIVEKPTRENILPEIEKSKTLSPIEQPADRDIKIIDTKNTTSKTEITATPPATDTEIATLNTEFAIEKTIIESEALGEIFPEPLLVQLSASDIGSAAKTEYIEVEKKLPEPPLQEEAKDIKPSITTPITPKKSEITSEITEILPEEYPTEVIENTAKIVEKDTLYIPEIEEDKIEEHIDNSITSDKETPIATPHEPSIDDQIITKEITLEVKKEPHTFIEWLKLLDGNLQIQTTEALKEPENWIEIPRYEVEQTLAQKKEIQQEEQKLFEPNFEEGEVDLFNEIDEEVSKVATDSVQFKQDMMTETLAKIYHKQGKYDKALEIYNTLRLKFPEKSAYFAALIEKLEKEK